LFAWVVSGIDNTLKEIGQSVKVVSGATIPFTALDDNKHIQGHLDYIHETLVNNSLTTPWPGDRREPAYQERDGYQESDSYQERDDDYSERGPRHENRQRRDESQPREGTARNALPPPRRESRRGGSRGR